MKGLNVIFANKKLHTWLIYGQSYFPMVTLFIVKLYA